MSLQNTYILSGIPRSGTTYLSAVLHHPPSGVTVSDPDGFWVNSYAKHGKSSIIIEQIEYWRRIILAGEAVPSLDDTPGLRGEGPVDSWSQPKHRASYALDESYWLGLKNPEVFLCHLEILLEAGLKCVISVRHPVLTINSWIWHPRGGLSRLPESERKDAQEFGNGCCVVYESQAADPLERCIDLYNYLASLICSEVTNSQMMIVRWEDWFISGTALFDEIIEFLGMPVIHKLTPSPLASDLEVQLNDGELERVLRGCESAAELGYQARNGRLAWPS